MFFQALMILLISKSICANISPICARVPNGYFVRSSRSCDSYNQCIDGQPNFGACPKGFSFNPSNQLCDRNLDVDCDQCSSYGIQNIPYPDNCSMYYRCVNGIRTTMRCAENLLFDRYFGDCNIAERVICEQKNTICEQFRIPDWPGAVLIGNPLDCSSYYYCISGRAIEAVCPSGLFYNPYTATCQMKDKENFCQGIGPIITTPLPEFTTREEWATESATTTSVRIIYVTRPPSTTITDSTTEQTTTEITSTSTVQPSSTTTTEASTEGTTTTPEETTTDTTTEETTEDDVEEETETTITTSPPATPTCEAGVTGYFPMPYPDNCTRYYYCSRGILRYQLNCQAGEFFTPGSDRCSKDVPPGCEHLVE